MLECSYRELREWHDTTHVVHLSGAKYAPKHTEATWAEVFHVAQSRIVARIVDSGHALELTWIHARDAKTLVLGVGPESIIPGAWVGSLDGHARVVFATEAGSVHTIALGPNFDWIEGLSASEILHALEDAGFYTTRLESGKGMQAMVLKVVAALNESAAVYTLVVGYSDGTLLYLQAENGNRILYERTLRPAEVVLGEQPLRWSLFGEARRKAEEAARIQQRHREFLDANRIPARLYATRDAHESTSTALSTVDQAVSIAIFKMATGDVVIAMSRDGRLAFYDALNDDTSFASVSVGGVDKKESFPSLSLGSWARPLVKLISTGDALASYLLVAWPLSASATDALFSLFLLSGSPAESTRPASKFQMTKLLDLPESTSLGTLVDFDFNNGHVWTLWDDAGIVKVRSLPLNLDGSSAFAGSWAPVDTAALNEGQNWTPRFYDALLDANPGDPVAILLSEVFSGNYSLPAIKKALTLFKQRSHSSSPIALDADTDMDVELDALTLRQDILQSVGSHIRLDPLEPARYVREMRREYLRFLSILNETRQDALVPLAVAADRDATTLLLSDAVATLFTDSAWDLLHTETAQIGRTLLTTAAPPVSLRADALLLHAPRDSLVSPNTALTALLEPSESLTWSSVSLDEEVANIIAALEEPISVPPSTFIDTYYSTYEHMINTRWYLAKYTYLAVAVALQKDTHLLDSLADLLFLYSQLRTWLLTDISCHAQDRIPNALPAALSSHLKEPVDVSTDPASVPTLLRAIMRQVPPSQSLLEWIRDHSGTNVVVFLLRHAAPGVIIQTLQKLQLAQLSPGPATSYAIGVASLALGVLPLAQASFEHALAHFDSSLAFIAASPIRGSNVTSVADLATVLSDVFLSVGMPVAVADYAQRAFFLANPATASSSALTPGHLALLKKLYSAYISLNQFDDAYALLVSEPRLASQELMSLLVTAACQHSHVDKILSYPFPDNLRVLFERVLTVNARTHDPALSPDYLGILTSYHIFRDEPRKAASALFFKAQKFAQRNNLQGELGAYLAAENCLCTVPDTANRWFIAPRDPSQVPQALNAPVLSRFLLIAAKHAANEPLTQVEEATANGVSPLLLVSDIQQTQAAAPSHKSALASAPPSVLSVDVVSYSELRRRIVLIQSLLKLSAAGVDILPQRNVIPDRDIVSLLTSLDMFADALTLAAASGIDRSPILALLTERAFAVASSPANNLGEHPVSSWAPVAGAPPRTAAGSLAPVNAWLDDFAPAVAGSVGDRAWSVLTTALKSCASDEPARAFRFYSFVAESLFSLDKNAALPLPIYTHILEHFPVALLGPLIKFSRWDAALSVALHILSAKQKGSFSHPLPFALFDRLILEAPQSASLLEERLEAIARSA